MMAPESERATPLFIPLKTEYFEAFASGSKTTEYRVFGPHWNFLTCLIGRPVILSKGYGKRARLKGTVVAFTRSKEPTKTAAWKACYGDRDCEAACIEIKVAENHEEAQGTETA